MIEFLLAPQNFPFTTALMVMLIIAVLEGVGAMIGVGLSALLDTFIPNMEIDLGIESPDLDTYGPFDKLLSWVSVKGVPLFVLFIIFLLLFGLIGLLVQDFTQSLFGFLLPALIASVITLVLTVPLVKGTTSLLSRILPKDETSAISHGSLIGRRAEIILGEARQGYPSQAKVRDRFGKIHYLMVEPEESGIIFSKGDLILLIKYDGVCFYAIQTQSEELKENS